MYNILLYTVGRRRRTVKPLLGRKPWCQNSLKIA